MQGFEPGWEQALYHYTTYPVERVWFGILDERLIKYGKPSEKKHRLAVVPTVDT